MALFLGRPRLINREDASFPVPLNLKYPKNPARTLLLASETSPLLGMGSFLCLAHKVHDMLSLSAQGVFAQDYSKLQALHHEICALGYEVPPQLRVDDNDATSRTAALRHNIMRLSILNSINTVLVALHRPFITTHRASRSAAVNAALEGLDIQNSIFGLVPHAQTRFYGTTFSTLESCIFLCGIMMELPPLDPVEDRRIRQGILQGIGRLSTIKDRSILAQSGEKILHKFYGDIESSRQPNLFRSSNQSPHSGRDEDIFPFGEWRIPSPQQPAYDFFQLLLSNDWDLGEMFDPTQESN